MGQGKKTIWQEQGERYGLFGASGSGKTTKARDIIRNTNRLIVFDSVKAEWQNNAKSWLGRTAIVCDPAELPKVLAKYWQKGFRIVVRARFGHEIQDLDYVSGVIFNAQAGFGSQHNAKITLFIDEAQEGAPTGLKFKLPTSNILRLATMGRGRGVNLIVASQRIKSVDINIRSNLTGLYIFRLADLADVQEARRILMGRDAGSIPNFSYFYKDQNGIINFFQKK